MKNDDLNAVLHVQPFRPFDIRLTDSRALPVNHPEYVALHPGGSIMIYFTEREGFEIIALDKIVGLNVRPKIGKRA